MSIPETEIAHVMRYRQAVDTLRQTLANVITGALIAGMEPDDVAVELVAAAKHCDDISRGNRRSKPNKEDNP